MINRLFYIGIVGFWLTMTTLLVRMQIAPADSSVRQIPPGHILRVMFEHEQASDLNISSGGLRYGSIVVRPFLEPKDERVLFFGGSSLLRAGYLPQDRLSLEGRIFLDSDFKMVRAHGSLGLRKAGLDLTYNYDRAAQTFTYSLQEYGRTLRAETIPLDRRGLNQMLLTLQVDPAIIDSAVVSTGEPTLTARFAKFDFRDEKVDAYCLVLKRESTTLAEIYVSQLGQILQVKTPFGLQLAPSELLP